MIDPSLLRLFVGVAQAGSFSRAAQQLAASQSAVSRAVQRLEDQVGTRLLDRTTRSVTPTAAGVAFLADARSILDRLAVAATNARQIGAGARAELRVALCPTTGSAGVIRGLAAFHARWPDVGLHFASLLSNLQPAALRASEIDVGIMQVEPPGVEGVEWEVIARHNLVVAVPGVWKLSRAPVLKLADLRDRPWLMPSAALAPAWRATCIDLCKRAGFEPRIAGVVDDPLTARVMIACGIGATFFHDVGTTDTTDVIDRFRFDDPPPPPPSETAVAWAAGSHGPHVGELVACLRETAAV